MRPKDVGQLLGLVLPLVMAACTATSGTASPMPSPGLKLSIQNSTTIEVTLVVNGAVVEKVPPGTYENPIRGGLPPLPWNVETRSPSGRTLSTLVVHEGDFWQTTLPNGDGGEKGDAVRVDLSCGRIDLWYGPPLAGPGYNPDASYSPGDCT